MANYHRANKLALLEYRLTQASAALEDVLPLFTSTEYEELLVALRGYLSYCANVSKERKLEDMR